MAEVEGTVPSSWYIEVKAERDRLRVALASERTLRELAEQERDKAQDKLAAERAARGPESKS